MSKKIVITGGAGFIGSSLGFKLCSQGHDVTLIDNMSFGYEENLKVDDKSFGTFVAADIRDKNISDLFKKADCVFHFAAISALPTCQSEPYRAIDNNVAGTANVLEAARISGVRKVVFASTAAIYENNKIFPCKESDETDPTLIYSVSKKQAEMLCMSYVRDCDMDISITRYYNVYGPNQDIKRKSPPFVAYVIRELLAGRQPILHSDGDQKRDYVYISDVNEMNIACMNKPNSKGQIFNVASGNAYSVKQIVEIIQKCIGTNLGPVYREADKYWNLYPELFSGEYKLDKEKVISEVNKFTLGSTEHSKAILEWETKVTIEEGLRSVVNKSIEVL